MTTKVKKPLTLSREKKAKENQLMREAEHKINEASAYLAERRKAYVESAFVAFCGNPYVVENLKPAEIAARSIECADALIEALYVNPIMEAKKKDAVQEGK